jgi:tetratricopeptide (TPR) repeat protein
LAWQANQQRRIATDILNDLSTRPALNSANPISGAAVLASLKTLTPESTTPLATFLHSNEQLIRLGAIDAAGNVPFPQRIPLLVDLLHDSTLAIRLAAANLLAGADKSSLSEKQRADLDAALNEFKSWLSRDADRAETLASLAALQAAEGDLAAAKASFEKAMQRDDTSLTVLLNFADFHRAQGNDAAAEPMLSRASSLYPEAAAVHFALGLLRVRQQRTAEAVPELSQASRLSPDESHYAYVYAVSLYTTGQTAAAFRVLGEAKKRFPANAEIIAALRSYCAEQKNRTVACAGL